MKQNQKKLLLKDLCGRLPYGVKVEALGLLKTISDDYDNRGLINAHVLNGLNLGYHFKTYSIDCIEKVPLFDRKGVCNIKPYLFPLSSMTEEQKDEIRNRFCYEWETDEDVSDLWKHELEFGYALEFIQWCYENHLDISGLIPKGLAVDCTCLNIY